MPIGHKVFDQADYSNSQAKCSTYGKIEYDKGEIDKGQYCTKVIEFKLILCFDFEELFDFFHLE